MRKWIVGIMERVALITLGLAVGVGLGLSFAPHHSVSRCWAATIEESKTPEPPQPWKDEPEESIYIHPEMWKQVGLDTVGWEKGLVVCETAFDGFCDTIRSEDNTIAMYWWWHQGGEAWLPTTHPVYQKKQMDD